MTDTAASTTAVIEIVDVAKIAAPPKEKRTGARMKLLNDLQPKGSGKSSVKQEKRTSIKILNNNDEATTGSGTPKPDRRSTGKTSLSSSSPAGSVKILNEKRAAPAASTPVETAKIKTSPSKKKKMDHYVLQAIKSENSAKVDNKTSSTIEVEDEDTIDFILAENDDIELAPSKGGNDDEFVVSGVEEDDDEDDDGDDTLGEGSVNRTSGTNSDLKEMVEHVCGKCYKTFRRVKSLKKHLEFCRYDSGYHLRKADMLKNLEKIEKDAVVMEKKDICFCCSESYDTFHVGLKEFRILLYISNRISYFQLGHINCPDCPKSFKTQTSYERHIFITHSEFSDYPCSICNAKLRSAALLKLHEQQHQSRGKPYACKICGKDFTRSYHLKRHQKYSSCSANENDTMSCKVCDRVFYRLDNLRAHLKQHLGTQVVKKPEYMCHVCKNCFYSLSTLK